MWQVEYSRSAIQALRKMPRNAAETIRSKIVALAADPFASNNNATKLQGRQGYRLRVGDWRVLYDLDDDRVVVLVIDIRPRGGAYR